MYLLPVSRAPDSPRQGTGGVDWAEGTTVSGRVLNLTARVGGDLHGAVPGLVWIPGARFLRHHGDGHLAPRRGAPGLRCGLPQQQVR